LRLEGTCLGDVEIEGENIITVPEGIPGFPHSKRYVMLENDKDSPFKWLQSIDESDLAFIIINPLYFKADYKIRIDHRDISILEPFDLDDMLVMVIVTIQRDPKQITANLKGPLIINPKNRLAKQVVLVDSEYPTRHHINSIMFPQDHDSHPRTMLETL